MNKNSYMWVKGRDWVVEVKPTPKQLFQLSILFAFAGMGQDSDFIDLIIDKNRYLGYCSMGNVIYAQPTPYNADKKVTYDDIISAITEYIKEAI